MFREGDTIPSTRRPIAAAKGQPAATLSYPIMFEAMYEHAQEGICLPIWLLVHPILFLISRGAY